MPAALRHQIRRHIGGVVTQRLISSKTTEHNCAPVLFEQTGDIGNTTNLGGGTKHRQLLLVIVKAWSVSCFD